MPAGAHGCIHDNITGTNGQKLTHLLHEDGGVTSDSIAFHSRVPRGPKAGGLSLLLGDTHTPSATRHEDCRDTVQSSVAYMRELWLMATLALPTLLQNSIAARRTPRIGDSVHFESRGVVRAFRLRFHC